jgi:hypothetical protein
VGKDGLKDVFWPTNVVQSATHDRPAVSWQLGNLSHDVKKTVAPLCQTGLPNSTVYVKAWRDIQPHTLPEASNAFFTSSNVTFTEKKNTLKAQYGTLWNKKIAYRHRTAYMEGQGIARDTHCPLCKDADSIGHITQQLHTQRSKESVDL